MRWRLDNPHFLGPFEALLSVDLTKSGRFLLRTYGGKLGRDMVGLGVGGAPVVFSRSSCSFSWTWIAAPDQFVLGVVYKNKASHHHVARDAGGLFSVNKQATGASSLNAVIEHLRQSYPWWPVPLTEGIPK